MYRPAVVRPKNLITAGPFILYESDIVIRLSEKKKKMYHYYVIQTFVLKK